MLRRAARGLTHTVRCLLFRHFPWLQVKVPRSVDPNFVAQSDSLAVTSVFGNWQCSAGAVQASGATARWALRREVVVVAVALARAACPPPAVAASDAHRNS